MAYAEKFHPPELPQDAGTLRQQLQSIVVLRSLQGQVVPPTSPATRFLLAYLMVTDKAVREYRYGCLRMQDQMQQGGIQTLLEAVGAFENCINATKRSLRLFECLVGQVGAMSIDRPTRKLTQRWSKSLTQVRDGIEHVDKDIEGLLPGAAHMLSINKSGDVLEIGSHTLSFEALGSTLEKLHALGASLVKDFSEKLVDHSAT